MTKAQMIAALRAVVECSKIDADKWYGDAYFDGKAAAYKELLAMLDVYRDAYASSEAAAPPGYRTQITQLAQHVC